MIKKKGDKSKKSTKKKNTKKTIIKSPKISKEDTKLGKILIENFIGLQKVMVNLSTRFDELSTQISKLLELFEISAKALAEKDITIQQNSKNDEKILQEIDNLSNQNKIIARGLTLMHKRLSGEPEEPIEEKPPMPFPSGPRHPSMQPQIRKTIPSLDQKTPPLQNPMDGYQKSIASERSTKPQE